MSPTSPITSILGEVTKVFLRYESKASLRSKLWISQGKVVATFRFQYGVNIAKNVTTGSRSYILAVFSAIKAKLWQ